jgi:hypothetical protein
MGQCLLSMRPTTAGLALLLHSCRLSCHTQTASLPATSTAHAACYHDAPSKPMPHPRSPGPHPTLYLLFSLAVSLGRCVRAWSTCTAMAWRTGT